MKTYRRRSRKIKVGFIICVVIILLIAVGVFLLTGDSNKVKEYIIIEAGGSVPDIEEFFINHKTAGRFITDISAIDTNKTGSTEISLEIGKKIYMSVLRIEDTVPPTGNPVELYIFNGNEVAPEDFVTDIKDATQVICSYANESEPDLNKPGWQDITVILTDEGQNKTEIKSKLYILDVIEELIIEAGTTVNLTAEDFIRNYLELEGLVFISPINERTSALSSVLGSCYVTLELKNYSATSILKIVDTIPPTGEPVELYIFKNTEISPNDFVTDIKDVTKVTCEYKAQPDLTRKRWQDVTVILTDEGNNKTEIKSRLYIFDVIGELVIEAGTVKNILPEDFVTNYIENKDLSFAKTHGINFKVPGEYPVMLELGNYIAESNVKIADTTPPTARTQNLRIYINKSVPAADFVYDIADISEVTVRYKTNPDFSSEGTQTVYIILEDAYGNITEYTARLTVINDTTPPRIAGELNKSVVVGGTISYRTGITVTDDYDKNVQLVVDSSQVNLNKAGKYTVIYSATDESGNRTEVKGTVTVNAIDMILVNELADGILAKIITDNMSRNDKARAIFNWVHGKMKYSSSLSPRKIAQASYNCFTRGSGDCYTYMAGSQVLLTRAGIQNRTVERVSDARTRHFWNIVNTGGGWYHFDVCPTPGNAVTLSKRFMFSESQARQYTEDISGGYRYYEYDKSTIPEVAE